METVRNGQIVWPYCKECGCRLEVFKIGSRIYARHYISWASLNFPLFDARGCRCGIFKNEVIHDDESHTVKHSQLYKGVPVIIYG